MSFFGRNTPSMASVQSALSQTLQRARPLSRNVHITHIRPKPTTPSPMASTSRSATSSATSTLGSGLSSSAAGVAGPNGSGPVKKTSGHLVWYREIVPAMIPILLLSTTIFLSLTLLRTHLSHNLTLSESATKITELETQLARMRQQQRRARERERKERERILPIVVERVLQKVGAMSEELQEEEEAEPRLLV